MKNSHVRALNQRAILEAVYNKDHVSRADLARQLKMSKPAMADIVADLLAQGLMEELGEGACGEGGGRKPLLLRFRKEHKYIVSIDYYYTDSIFVLCNILGEVVNRIEIHQAPHQNFDAWVQLAINAISTLLLAQNIKDADLAAIGISSPGVIGPHGPLINSRQFGAFDASVLREALAENFHCPIYIKNSTNASALGEWHKGAGQNTRNMIYLSCGQGLGAGFILEGKLYEGSQFAAGEIAGFVTPDSWQSSKSLEQRICIAGLLEQVQQEAPPETLVKFGGQVTFDRLVEVWQGGDAYLVQVLDDIGLALGCLLSNLVMTVNCDLVVLGGDYKVFQSQLLERIDRVIQRCCIIPAPVVISQLGEQSGVLGLVAMCRELYFDHICGLDAADDSD